MHAFVAVVETGSFTRAAERLLVSQVAISRAIQRLESQLQLHLLVRDPTSVRVTPAGQAYFAQIRPALDMLEAAVPTRQKSKVQDLRLAASPTLSMRWLVPRLPSLYARHPRMHIAFKRYLHDDDFLREDVDCWLVPMKKAGQRWPKHIRASYIIGREITVICHPSLTREIKSAADVLRYPLLYDAGYPGNWQDWCRANDLPTDAIRLTTGFDLSAGLIEAVATNLGVGVVPSCLIERELMENRVVCPISTVASSGRGYYLCIRRARETESLYSAFSQWLKGQVGTRRLAD